MSSTPSSASSDETYSDVMLGNTQTINVGEQKTLGVKWCVETDHLVLDVSDVGQQARDLQPIKRNIVSLVGRIYEPLGFLSPMVVCLKSLFQQLCQLKLEWDEPLQGELLTKWESMMVELQDSKQVLIPRYLLNSVNRQIISYQLVGFCDASKRAYATVVYLRINALDGTYVKFLVSKTKVAPSQTRTIPRLELLSALLLSRLMANVRRSLEPVPSVSHTICYTDSKVALYCIKGASKEWKQFVQNRTTGLYSQMQPGCTVLEETIQLIYLLEECHSPS